MLKVCMVIVIIIFTLFLVGYVFAVSLGAFYSSFDQKPEKNPREFDDFCISARHLYQAKHYFSIPQDINHNVSCFTCCCLYGIGWLHHFFSLQHIGQTSAEMSLQLAVI